MSEDIIVAIIGASAIVVVALLTIAVEVLRRQNTKQHNDNYSLLQSIDGTVKTIDQKVDVHGEWIAGHQATHEALGTGGYRPDVARRRAHHQGEPT